MENVNLKEHKDRYLKLHKYLDELIGDWIMNTGKLPSQCTAMDLMEWSYKETTNPTEREKD